MKNVFGDIKEACQYVGIILVAGGGSGNIERNTTTADDCTHEDVDGCICTHAKLLTK